MGDAGKSCETNNEGISRMSGGKTKQPDFEQCKMACIANKMCAAIDYYSQTHYCNLYTEACTTPLGDWDSPSSYRIIRQSLEDSETALGITEEDSESELAFPYPRIRNQNYGPFTSFPGRNIARFGRNIYRDDVSNTGTWGGKCTCPDGHYYWVADNRDYCGTLACFGGTYDKNNCNRRPGRWTHKSVTCGRRYNEEAAETELAITKEDSESAVAIPPNGAWKYIHPTLACEVNDEGIQRKNGGNLKLPSLDECKLRCNNDLSCLAIDYYSVTQWCNIFTEVCSTPKRSADGASSYKIVRRKVTAEETEDTVGFEDYKKLTYFTQDNPVINFFAIVGGLVLVYNAINIAYQKYSSQHAYIGFDNQEVIEEC